MNYFGWSYPPGCSGTPDEDAGPCECCGYSVDSDNCICPECPECGEVGNKDCYSNNREHYGKHLVYSTNQLVGVAKARIRDLEEQIVGENEHIEMLLDRS